MSQTSNNTPEKTLRGVELTEQERHRLLAAERRRLALDVLAGSSVPVDLEELARRIAERESGNPADGRTVERVAVSLHHAHLPRMDEVGVLDYDPEENRIDPDGLFEFE